MSARNRLPKWFKWEFWPFGIFYIPVAFVFMYYAIRTRTLSFFTLVNPGMKLGGMIDYSKNDIQQQLPKKNNLKSIFFSFVPSSEEIITGMKKEEISFPVILKPDRGERGWKVEKVSTMEELQRYRSDAPSQILLQEYIDLPEEYGIMYYRFPNEKKGHISSVVIREFLSVTGDGVSSLFQLFEKSERCLYHLEMLKSLYRNEMQNILSAGEKKILVEIGNHSRGTTFLNGNHLISEGLTKLFDEVSRSLQEWYFGRFDVRTNSWSDLLKGNFNVLEVNGVNSEPAHIYDPNMSIFNAYRALFNHWNIIYQISMQNKKRGFKAEPALEVLKKIRWHLQMKKQRPN